MVKIFILSLILVGSMTVKAQSQSNPDELKIYPVLWQQQAAEYRALCYQAFNIAKLRLDEIPGRKFRKGKLAIITDLDETILDNSYQEAQSIKDGKTYSNESWKVWSDKSAATAVPGAVEFLQAAHEKGTVIFYISNRDTSEVRSTLINLQRLQLPDADTSHMLFLSSTSSKEARRQIVMGKFNVIMLMGDNLNDFTQAFEGKLGPDRKLETDKARDNWGKKFIVLPNPVYGEWENAIYDYQHGLTPEQKAKKRDEKMIGY